VPVPTFAVLDDFNRADSASLGGNWVLQDANNPGISGNRMGSHSGIAWWPTFFPPVFESYYTLAVLPTSDFYHWAGFDTKNSSGSGYKYQITGATGQVVLIRVASGGETILSGSSGGAVAAGDVMVFARSQSGWISVTRVRAGTPTVLCSAVDNTYSGYGCMGLGLNDATGRIDDFGGGAYPYYGNPFPSTGILDTFNRTDESPLAGGFAGPIEVGVAQLKIVSNKATGITAGVGESYWNTAFGADQEAYVKNVDNLKVELAVRLTNLNSSSLTGYWAVFYAGSSTVVDVFKVVNNAFTTLFSGPVTVYAANDILGLSVVGSRINCYRNGVCILSLVDTAVTGGGKIGLKGNASVTMDDFGGGDYVGLGRRRMGMT